MRIKLREHIKRCVEYLGAAPSPKTLQEICQDTGMPRATANKAMLKATRGRAAKYVSRGKIPSNPRMKYAYTITDLGKNTTMTKILREAGCPMKRKARKRTRRILERKSLKREVRKLQAECAMLRAELSRMPTGQLL